MTTLGFSSFSAQDTDCAGVINGSAMIDECGDCHQAYLYNFITHAVTFIDSVEGVEAGPNEMVVLPNDPGNPYWNQACSSVPGCTDVTACNFNYLATEDDGTCGILDDCEECQEPYCYNPVTHEVSYITPDECGSNVWVGVESLNSPMNPYWNSLCSDCAGVINGSAMIDECGDCHQAYLYNFITHAVTFIDSVEGVEAGPNEMVVLPNDPGNPYWNQACSSVPGCTDVTACNFNYLATEDDGTCGILDDCEECQEPYCYNPVTHEVSYITLDECGSDVWVGVESLNSPMNPYWNSTCEIYGCTYPNACNYSSSANTDDGNCEWITCVLEGCTYESAENYHPDATHDDGSCIFTEESCPADLDDDGVVATGDLLLFLAEFSATCD